MIAFPLLERYLRQKAGLPPEESLNWKFYEELSNLFPSLQTKEKAKEFWQVYRNGILHQATFSNRDKKKRSLPTGGLGNQSEIILHNSADNLYLLNPVEFAKYITEKIEGDFPTFEGAGSEAPSLAVVSQRPWPYAVTTGVTSAATI